jgi:tRNA threonylcarbamoyladenosine biosynthesis protein TsaE
MEFIFSLNEIEATVKKVLAEKLEKVILFNGEMGAGKTTFIKAICKNLGVADLTSSPTFSLVNEYQIPKNQLIYHFDFYRLKKEEEALDMGIDEYLYSGNWCFIEWSEKIPNLIPKNHSVIDFEILIDGKRAIKLK